MLDLWVRLVLLLMLVWLIAEHYQQWGKMRGSQPIRIKLIKQVIQVVD